MITTGHHNTNTDMAPFFAHAFLTGQKGQHRQQGPYHASSGEFVRRFFLALAIFLLH
jgi:hypothetical protein